MNYFRQAICILLFSGCFTGALAQKGMITGKVTDTRGEPVPYASVALFSAQDSTLEGGGASDDHGRFTVESAPGDYFIRVSFLSFADRVVPGIHVEAGATVPLGQVVLQENSQLLDEFVVEAEKSQMELRLDKRVFNVGKDLSNVGSNASEILSNVPSVEVDVDGNVSLRGSGNVRILIDGKPSGLTGEANADALRMLQGSMIEQVEVITNPSSRYDAEGEVGIINIVLKKERKQGVNGAFEVTAGYPHNYGGSFSLNYRRNGVNLFASNGTSYRQTPGNGHSLHRYDGPDTNYYYRNDREHSRGGLSNMTRAGADFYISEKNVLTTALLYELSDGNNDALIKYLDLNNTDEVLVTTVRDELENEMTQNIEATLSFRRTFSQEGRSWNTDVKWTQNDDSEDASLIQTSSLPSVAPYNQRSSNTENEKNYLFQSDYVQPVGGAGKFETGVKASLRRIENAYSVELNNTGEWLPLADFTNELRYHEDIYAAYTMYSNKYKKLSYQGGLRAEYSDIRTELVRTGERNPRSYLNFFPSAHLSYELTENTSVQLSYSRRLSRPKFRELIPFSAYSDARNLRIGNPNLDPEYTNSLEAGYLRTFTRGSFLGSVYYRHTTGVVQRITFTDTTGLIVTYPINLSTQDAIGIEANVSYEFTKWWRVNGNINLYRAIVNGSYEGRTYHSDTYTATGRGTSVFKLPKDISLQLSANYSAPRESTQGRILAMYHADLGLSKDLLKGNGTLTGSIRDVFNTRRFRSVTNTGYLYAESDFQWRARQFLLTFTYRLNQKKKPAGGNNNTYEGEFE